VTALGSLGVPPDEAAIVADVLLDADLRGSATHGILRLPLYADRVRRGTYTAVARIETVTDRGAVAHLDAGFALGPVAAVRAMRLACDKAVEGGIGLVLVRRASHFGTAGYHARQATARGLIGIAASNTAAMLVPPGGQRAAIGNSPLAIAFPDGEGGAAFVTDTAFSATSLGRILLARAEGRPIPPDWALGTNGAPTADPADALTAGLLQAMSGGKGFALALAVEALTGLLAGAGFGPKLPSIYRQPDQTQDLGQLFLAIDPGVFLSPTDLRARIATLRASVERAADPAPRLPGDRGAAAARGALDVSLPRAVVDDLARLAFSLGFPPLQPKDAPA
jgi:LDH2 family malate/lactate/ureidoglycolate dehydrogenase